MLQNSKPLSISKPFSGVNIPEIEIQEEESEREEDYEENSSSDKDKFQDDFFPEEPINFNNEINNGNQGYTQKSFLRKQTSENLDLVEKNTENQDSFTRKRAISICDDNLFHY